MGIGTSTRVNDVGDDKALGPCLRQEGWDMVVMPCFSDRGGGVGWGGGVYGSQLV